MADFACDHLEDRPARLVGAPQFLLATAFFELVVDRFKQPGQPLEAADDGPRRQIQAMTAQIVELFVGGASVVVLVEQDLHPHRDAKRAVRQYARHNRRGNDGG